MRKSFFAAVAGATLLTSPVIAETPDEWIALGARVHGAFGSFIPLGIKIGLAATERLKTQPRELVVTYYDSDKSPCACFADGIAIATYTSVGQRTLTIAPEKAPEGALATAIIRPRKGGPGFKYTINISALAKLGPMASGHVNRIKRPNTWLHRPMLQNVKKALANTEPSTHGTSRTSRDVRLESGMRARADID